MDTKLRNRYGYPTECTFCNDFPEKPKEVSRIDPFHKAGEKLKLMLIGQDPTIYDDPDRVNTVLMLNEDKGRNGQLRRWLEMELFGIDNFNKIEIYATNLVKCQFSKPPAKSPEGALRFLFPRFQMCKVHLIKEVETYQPDIILSFGQPTHVLFSGLLEIINGNLKKAMKDDFTGHFIKARINQTEFLYSPSLHIKTYRVAITYGKAIIDFKEGLAEKLK